MRFLLEFNILYRVSAKGVRRMVALVPTGSVLVDNVVQIPDGSCVVFL